MFCKSGPRKLRGKIIGTAVCCVVYDSCAQWYAHKCQQFLNSCLVRLRKCLQCFDTVGWAAGRASSL